MALGLVWKGSGPVDPYPRPCTYSVLEDSSFRKGALLNFHVPLDECMLDVPRCLLLSLCCSA